jgi:outer membrane biosynthesis protein TonB
MIPRTLVPVNVRPVRPDEAKKVGTRITTNMDDRTVVPSGRSEAPPLTGKSNIPQYMPLGVLVHRTLVERGMPIKEFERPEHPHEILPLDILDSRVVVPAHVEPMAPEQIAVLERPPELTENLKEVIDADIFITGDANLLIEPEEKRDTKFDLITRVLSVIVHIGLILFLISIPKLFPPHIPTQEEIARAQEQLTYVLPPEEPPAPPAPPAPKMRITPKTLKKIAPPVEQPTPQPTPTPAPEAARPTPELPEAPKPQPAAPSQPNQPSEIIPIKPQPQSQSKLNLGLPSVTPGKAIQDQLSDAIRHNSGGGIQQFPGSGGPAGPGGPGMQGAVQILTDTQGVDFSSYIQRLLATLRRNWYAVMPESANLGDKGMVFTTFQINKDGSIPSPDPTLERTSGKEPLDNAAMSAIHASNPFEPLPSQFKGDNIRLRIVFLYNLPMDYAK